MKHKFFKTIGREQLINKIKKIKYEEYEKIETKDALGRVLSEDIIAKEDSPLCNRSSMDGYAVKAKNTFGALESLPAYLECVGSVLVNKFPDRQISDYECMQIPTGGSLPNGANSVAMVEYTKKIGETTIEVYKSVAPNENIMLQGEDVKKNQILLKKGRKLRAQEIGILLAIGITKCTVYKKIECGIISTGDELLPVEKKIKPGEIRDINSYTLSCLIKQAGAGFIRYGIVKDDFKLLRASLDRALKENDIVFISGGSSVGTYDFTISVINSFENKKILSYGLSLSPGKPTICALVGNKLVVGLPGQVASALVVMRILFFPFLKFLMGEKDALEDKASFKAHLSRNIASKQGREDFVRVSISSKNDKVIASPVTAKSGLLTSLINSDGLIKIPANCEGFYENDLVDIIRW